MAALLLLVGAIGVVFGVAWLSWPAGIAAAGVLLLLAGIDLRR